MRKLTPEEVAMVCPLFAFDGEVRSIKPFGNGHINDTFRAGGNRADESDPIVEHMGISLPHSPPSPVASSAPCTAC